MTGKHDIYVFAEGDEFLVRPAVVAVAGGAGKKLKVRNLTGRPISLSFPDEVIQDGFTVDSAAECFELTLHPRAGTIYDYTVEVVRADGTRKRAVGNSWPKIIVDP